MNSTFCPVWECRCSTAYTNHHCRCVACRQWRHLDGRVVFELACVRCGCPIKTTAPDRTNPLCRDCRFVLTKEERIYWGRTVAA